MRFKFASALAASAAFVPFLVHAEGLSYSYLDAAYVNTDIDRFDEDVDGFALRGSYEFTDNVFVFAGYADQITSVAGFDIDLQTYDLGLGYAWPLGKALDAYGKVGYVSSQVSRFIGCQVVVCPRMLGGFLFPGGAVARDVGAAS